MRKLAPYYKEAKFRHINHQMTRISDENGYLFSRGIYPTKIRKEDLPEWYFDGVHGYAMGYYSAKGIVDMVYYPNYLVKNHLFKDDIIFVSYNGKIEHGDSVLSANGYDIAFYGHLIPTLLFHASKYSDFDIRGIVDGVLKKMEWYKQEGEMEWTTGLEKMKDDLKGIIRENDECDTNAGTAK